MIFVWEESITGYIEEQNAAAKDPIQDLITWIIDNFHTEIVWEVGHFDPWFDPEEEKKQIILGISKASETVIKLVQWEIEENLKKVGEA